MLYGGDHPSPFYDGCTVDTFAYRGLHSFVAFQMDLLRLVTCGDLQKDLSRDECLRYVVRHRGWGQVRREF